MKTTLLATLLVAFGATASATTLSFTPSTPNPFLGDTFTIDVVATTGLAEAITGFGFDYSLGSSNVLFSSYTIGSAFTDLVPGLLDPDVFAFANAPAGESGTNITLATFTFSANTVGTSLFSVFANTLSDPNFGLFILTNGEPSAVDINNSVLITVQEAVPEPATFGLGAMALAGLLAAARRRR